MVTPAGQREIRYHTHPNVSALDTAVVRNSETVTGKMCDGWLQVQLKINYCPPVGKVVARNDREHCFELNIQGAIMHFGIWWLDVAKRGAVDVLPVVNNEPVFEVDTDQQ